MFSTELMLPLAAVFISVAVAVGGMVFLVLSRMTPERARLRQLGAEGGGGAGLVLDAPTLTDSLSPAARRAASLMPTIPKSPADLNQLRRRLTMAGYRELSAAIWFSIAKVILPVALGVIALFTFGITRGWYYIAGAVLIGFLAPGFWLDRKIKLRQKAIRNGLPDALDLLIVSIEAGSSLDQAIVKAGEELAGPHPALAEEMRLITTEIRAGKPRSEALKNFAERTRVADVRSLVSMLLQTDRFGTSVAQSLRTHAATSRTKRRQMAEERAAKVGVKLVFPLVFFLFPALYAVILGPLVIRILRVFIQGIAGR
jgi:tight adherence protein C